MSSSRFKENDSLRRLKKKRVANNEYEAVTLIIQSNEVLRKRVMMRISELRAMSKESMLDIGQKRKNKDHENDLKQSE